MPASRTRLVIFLTYVCLATYLSGGDTYQGMAVQNVLKLSVREVFQFFITDEHSIHIVVVERVATMLQLVVVNDRDKRM